MARNFQSRPFVFLAGWFAAFAVLAWATPALGQRIQFQQQGNAAVIAPADGPAAEDAAENIFLPADRTTLKKLSDARKLLAGGRFGEAVRNLDAILGAPEDYFIRPDKKSPSRSLKGEVQRLLGQMPPEGRELYELQYGPQARAKLNEALATGNIAQLSEISQRFFHTRSGQEATFLLGLHHFDRGQPLAGALALRRLYEAPRAADEFEPALSLSLAACWLQSGMAQRARDVLVGLRQRRPGARVKVAGREVPLFADDAKAVEWLTDLVGMPPAAAAMEDWTMLRGDPARNASTAGGVPLLNMRWRVTTADNAATRAQIEQYQKSSAETGWPTIPAFHPLAVGDVVLMRTLHDLVAIDLATGKRLWAVPTDGPAAAAPGDENDEIQQGRQRMSPAVQRVWEDMTYGALSSDGRRVFSIEDAATDSTAADTPTVRHVMVVRNGKRRLLLLNRNGGDPKAPFNRLTAHDIRTGKLTWQIGGPAGPQPLGQSETFFLGPPLPLADQLYVLAETKGEVRLLALDAAAGRLLWSQQLTSAEPGVAQDPSRQLVGVSPSYADGVLVCPTSTGAVVAVDPATRELLWGYCCKQRDNNVSRGGFVIAGVWDPDVGPTTPSHWLDSGVSTSEGRVLAASVESDSLYCLSLIDGKLLWKRPRGDDLYVACVDRGEVVLVGRRAVHAVRLSDGQEAWNGRGLSLPEGAVPSGRGFLSSRQYVLPLNNASVVAVDLAAHRIAHVSNSRKGSVSGNLICHKGKIISQALCGVDAYDQRDVVVAEVRRRLAANPDDAEAIALRGELLLDADRRAEAIAALLRAYQLRPALETRETLREAILGGLRDDFAAYRGELPQIERLLDDASQRAALLRVTASGLRRAGQWGPAVDCYLRLFDLDTDRWPLDAIDKTLSVRRDRWIRSQLSEMRREVPPEAAEQIDQAVAERLQRALADRSLEPLQRFFDSFGDLPAAAPARDALARRLWAAGRPLEAELLTPPEATPAEAGSGVDWPLGIVEVGTAPTRGTQYGDRFGRGVLELQGNPGPFFRNALLQLDPNRMTIFAYDPLGRQSWQLPLTGNGQRPAINFGYTQNDACARGHLLFVFGGESQIFAIDTLGPRADGRPRVLWSQDLMASAGGAAGATAPLAFPWQQQFMQADESEPFAAMGREYLCFQQFRSLVALDLRNGEPLWTRQDLPQLNCDIFGDDDVVFVLPPDREEATVYRARDGAVVGTRRVPRVSRGQQTLPNGEVRKLYGRLQETCLATLGRRLLLWWPEGNQRMLTLVDPLEGCDLWPSRKFSAGARTAVVNNEVVGVLSPGGQFVLIAMADGRTLADVQLKAPTALGNIVLLSAGDQYFLLVGDPRYSNVSMQPLGASQPQSRPIHRGSLYAFDRQGKLLWPNPVAIENQMLLATQPAGLPVLTFACRSYDPTGNRNPRDRQKTSVLCIDKRTGRTVYKQDCFATLLSLTVMGDPQKKTVALITPQQTVTLKFTDKPWPAAPSKKP
jgi:outer membrane protein assembly factor BamB/tetratricopeptide (TPR) repeat protein